MVSLVLSQISLANSSAMCKPEDIIKPKNINNVTPTPTNKTVERHSGQILSPPKVVNHASD